MMYERGDGGDGDEGGDEYDDGDDDVYTGLSSRGLPPEHLGGPGRPSRDRPPGRLKHEV